MMSGVAEWCSARYFELSELQGFVLCYHVPKMLLRNVIGELVGWRGSELFR